MFPFDGPYRNPVRNMYTFFRHSVPQGLRNLLEYAPVIWHTREWDSGYLYELVAFKLKRMERVLRFGVASDRRNIADQIKATRLALERLHADDYLMKWSRNHKFNVEQAYKNDLNIVAKGIKQSLSWWD